MTDEATQPDSTIEASAETEPDAPAVRLHPIWRRVLVVVLLVVGMLLAPLSVSAVWVRNQIMQTDTYVANVRPLASDPQVQATVADELTTRIFALDQVQQALQQATGALPVPAQVLSGPLETGLQTAVHEIILRVLASDQFQTVWAEANSRAHSQIVGLLTGQGKVASVKDGKVVLDLTPIFSQINTALKDRGISILDNVPEAKVQEVAGNIVLFDAPVLSAAQAAIEILRIMALVLPVLMVAAFGLAIFLSANRRRTVIWMGLLVAAGMGLLALGVNTGRFIYLDALSSGSIPRATAAIVYNTLLRFMITSGRAVMLIGLLIAFGAFATGPSRSATKMRRLFQRASDSASDAGLDSGPVGHWVATHAKSLRIATIALSAVLLIWWERPTPRVVLLLVVLDLVALAVIEVLARSGSASGDAASAARDQKDWPDDRGSAPPEAPAAIT